MLHPLPYTKACFVCGSQNAAGLRLRFETDGATVQSRFTLDPKFAGFTNVIHGGIIATILDEVMVWAIGIQARRFAFCAEMSVRYLKPLSPGEEALAVGEVTHDRRQKLFETKGEIRRGPDIIATSTGKYIPVKGTEFQSGLVEFEGDVSYLFGRSEEKT